MSSGGTAMTDSMHQPHLPFAREQDAGADITLDEIRSALRNLRYGSVTIIVQDGVIIQIDRMEKRRLQSRRANQRGLQ
jgi:hypothetical protein